ncbi:formyl transferase [Akkermansiaceae bacterium]|nr:formyl transferase [Akkermansiaceae bacterium]
MVEDTPMPKRKFLKRRVKKFGYLKVGGQILFMIYNWFLYKKSKRRVGLIKRQYNLEGSCYPQEVFKKFKSINSEESIQFLGKKKPDVVIVNGTRIISKRVLNSVDAIFINTHVGITPSYRGVHGGYWSLVNRDYEKCGVTVHLVDEGIDTGGILYQDLIKITDLDDINTYPYLQIAVALPLLKRVINDLFKNGIKIIESLGSDSTFYSHPTLLEYLRNRYKGVK